MSVGVPGPVSLLIPPGTERYPAVILEAQGPRLLMSCSCQLQAGNAVLLETGTLAMLGEVIAARVLEGSTEAVIELDQAILATSDMASLAKSLIEGSPERRRTPH